MRKTVLLLMLNVIVILAYAQPSEATMMAKVRSYEKNVISVVWDGNPISERVADDGVLNNYYRRSYITKRKTKYKGITKVYSGGIQYKMVGGKYIFDQFLVGSVHYEGVPEPNREEILKLLKSDMVKYLKQNSIYSIVGEVSEITFPEDPEWYWRKLTNVEFYTKVTYTAKVSYTELEKAVRYYRITLFSDEYKGKWKDFLSSREINKKEVISKTKYTAEEIEAMPTYGSEIQTRNANSYLDALPKVAAIPKFETDQQLFYYVHDIILSKPVKEVEAYLYKLQSKSCYFKNSDVLRNPRAEKWVNNIRDHIDVFKKMYCQYPLVKHYQPGSITFLDKKNKRELQYQANKEDGTWKLSNIYYYPAPKSEANTMVNLNSNCQGKPDLTVRKIRQYKKGDKVNAKFRNGTFPYVIDKRDGTNDRYYIRAEGDPNGRGYWMNEKDLSPRTGGNSTTSTQKETKTNTTKTSTETFKVGDQIQMQTRTKGWLDGEIIRQLGSKYLIKFKGNYRDMWVSASNIRKKQ